MWIEAMNAKFKGIGRPYGKEQWDALLGHCQAVTDTPCVVFYKELLAAYPEAKVILTERDDAEQWFRSSLSTVIHFADLMIPQTWFAKLQALFSPADPKGLQLVELIMRNAPMFDALWRDYRNSTSTAKQLYHDYNAEVKRLVPKERLLVFNVKEGWTPLCNFLNEDIPDMEFPSRNSKAEFERNNGMIGEIIQSATRKNMALFGTGVVAILAMAAFALVKQK
jgi:hypothetical protein